MLKHWVVTYVAIAVMAALVLLGVNFWLAFPAVLLAKLGLDAWGAINVGSNYYMNVLCKGAGGEKAVALSFDDGPVNGGTAEILDILKAQQVPAAFFFIGNRVAEAPGLVRRAHEEGHLIGNHSYAHQTLFDLLPTSKMKQELQKANDAIEAAAGVKPLLFRPPYGVTNPMLARAVKAGGFTPVGWSIRSLDTVIKEEDQLFERVTRKISPGDIFLFHDTAAATAKILPALIKQLKREGYVLKRLDELLKIPAYA
ncbi:polysaccharide deacetylase family protein [Chitinophaga lutea]|uniref:Polysaccharide deacetylase family protein n=1 Tax=Chitinophaga lutea TaxID=2488634 RepID=A0A3N4PLB6_9BACT|nr:polysaccharide deacetylase family protein [Chitinophaga lutea]RPE09472.1 polysaccharide deacetylase family protein [Chitinophaga lutea]